MSKVNTKKVKISEICDICKSDKSITRAKIQTMKGEIPLYSATIGKPLGYVNFYNNDSPALLVVNDGDSGKTFIVNDNKYSIGKHVLGLKIKDEYKSEISLEYLQIISEPIFLQIAKGNGLKNLPGILIKNTYIELPINDDGSFDIDKQNNAVDKYNLIKQKKNALLDRRNLINSSFILYNHPKIKYSVVKFNSLFELKRGKIISREYVLKNNGNYPVYSTQVEEVFGYINKYMYDGDYLLWNTDGLAGYIKRVTGKFSLTNIVGIMILKEEYRNKNLSLEYLKYILEPIFRRNIKGRLGENGKNEYTKLNSTMIKNLNIEIPIPITAKGEYDLNKQNEIANKFNKCNMIKKRLVSQIDELLDIELI